MIRYLNYQHQPASRKNYFSQTVGNKIEENNEITNVRNKETHERINETNNKRTRTVGLAPCNDEIKCMSCCVRWFMHVLLSLK